MGSDFTNFPNEADTAFAGGETWLLLLEGVVDPLSSFVGVLSGLAVGGEGDAEAVVTAVVPGLLEEAAAGEGTLTAGDFDGDLTTVFPPVDKLIFPSCCLAVDAAFSGF